MFFCEKSHIDEVLTQNSQNTQRFQGVQKIS